MSISIDSIAFTETALPSRVRDIIRSVAAKYDVRISDIIGPRRTPHNLVVARFEAYHEVYKHPTNAGYYPSLPQIGAWFGGRDHTTIMYGISRHLGKPSGGRKMPKRLPPMANVRPVSPEVQAMVLTQFFAQQAAE